MTGNYGEGLPFTVRTLNRFIWNAIMKTMRLHTDGIIMHIGCHRGRRLRSTPRGDRHLVTWFVSFVLLVMQSMSLVAQEDADIAGRWHGTIDVPGSPLPIEIELERDGGGWSGSYTIAAQGIKEFPLEKISFDPPIVRFALGGGIPGAPHFTMELTENGSAMRGTFAQSGATMDASFGRSASAATAAPEVDLDALADDLDTYLRDAVTEWELPGLAVAIVTPDAEYVRGFGLRDRANGLPVTPSTLFMIGSTTKAFTSTIIGSLVDDGLLDWDEPVVTYLPDFKLHDAYATEHLRVRDLLSHVSGLPRHDLLWYASALSRRELFDRLIHLEPTAAPYQQWQYNNLMFMTAGVLAERVSGKSWEDLVRERIFSPLAMSRSTVTNAELLADGNRAVAYAITEKDEKPLPYHNLDAVGPAGSIASSAEDLTGWLRLNIGEGKAGDRTVASTGSMRTIRSPQVVISGQAGVEGAHFSLYALGWMVTSYRGMLLVHHGGAIDGFIAHIGFLPEKGIGFAVMTNTTMPFPEVAMFDLIDKTLGLEPLDHGKEMAAKAEIMMKQMEEATGERFDRVAGTSPSHPLGAYTGAFEHPAYGRVDITLEGKRLVMTSEGESHPMEHFHYDVFAIEAEESIADGVLLHFQQNARGDITGVAVPLEPAVDPILFTRMPDMRLTDPALLKKMTGTYATSTMTVTVDVDGSSLTVDVPGQQVYAMIPSLYVPGERAEFTLKGMEEFRIRFVEEKGTYVRLLFLQPNGTFPAERVH